MQALIGFFTFFGIAYVVSERRRSVNWKVVGIGVASQVVLAVAFLKLPFIGDGLLALNTVVVVLEEVTMEATRFMFGYLAGGTPPFEETTPGGSFIVAFRVLPLILVVSALSAVLFHWGILPFIIRAIAGVIQKRFRVSGALAFAASSSVFFGIIESPLLIQPYLDRLNRSELFALLVCGMSTVAGTVMVLYASVVGTVIDGALGHILVASVISIPAALVVAHLMIPPNDDDLHEEIFSHDKTSNSSMDALMTGTADGTKMIVSIIATIIVLFACVHLTNKFLSIIPTTDPLTLQVLLGTLFRPLVFLMGIPWEETETVGVLMATKTILNEFVAYLSLAKLDPPLSESSKLITMYAMCGFANLGSLGIVVGGLSSILPEERRTELAGLAMRAVVAGTLATMSTGAIVGIVMGLG